jgi:hypothetical protein
LARKLQKTREVEELLSRLVDLLEAQYLWETARHHRFVMEKLGEQHQLIAELFDLLVGSDQID